MFEYINKCIWENRTIDDSKISGFQKVKLYTKI